MDASVDELTCSLALDTLSWCLASKSGLRDNASTRTFDVPDLHSNLKLDSDMYVSHLAMLSKEVQ